MFKEREDFENFLKAYFIEKDIDKIMEYLSDEIQVSHIKKLCKIITKEEAKQFLLKELELEEKKYTYRILDFQKMQITKETYSTYANILLIDNSKNYKNFEIFVSAVWVKKGEKYKICTFNSLDSYFANIKDEEFYILDDEEDNFDEEESVELDNVSIGDFVHISSLDYDGRVLKINKNRVLVSTNRGKLEVDISDLSKAIETNKKNPTSQYSYQVDDVVLKKRVPLELNIIGLHVDEALNKLEEYIDSVIVKNYKQVRIIHGSGTGVLRKVVHEYLTKIKEVDSFRLGGLNEGGVGATVVYFK